MASLKTKKTKISPLQEILENNKSSEFPSEVEDLRLGMERRKFSYTMHVPERRSIQNSVKSNNHVQTRLRLNLLNAELILDKKPARFQPN